MCLDLHAESMIANPTAMITLNETLCLIVIAMLYTCNVSREKTHYVILGQLKYLGPLLLTWFNFNPGMDE